MKNKELSKKLKTLKKRLKALKKSKESVEVKELESIEDLVKDVLSYPEVKDEPRLLKELGKSKEMLRLYKHSLIKFKELQKKWT